MCIRDSHYEYWIDISNHKEEGLVGNKMPLRYVAEMVCDRIAACEVYKGKAYTLSLIHICADDRRDP